MRFSLYYFFLCLDVNSGFINFFITGDRLIIGVFYKHFNCAIRANNTKSFAMLLIDNISDTKLTLQIILTSLLYRVIKLQTTYFNWYFLIRNRLLFVDRLFNICFGILFFGYLIFQIGHRHERMLNNLWVWIYSCFPLIANFHSCIILCFPLYFHMGFWRIIKMWVIIIVDITTMQPK